MEHANESRDYYAEWCTLHGQEWLQGRWLSWPRPSLWPTSRLLSSILISILRISECFDSHLKHTLVHASGLTPSPALLVRVCSLATLLCVGHSHLLRLVDSTPISAETLPSRSRLLWHPRSLTLLFSLQFFAHETRLPTLGLFHVIALNCVQGRS